MKKLIPFTLFLIIASTDFSQAQTQIGLDLGPQVPIGGFSDGFRTGMGFSASGKYAVKDNILVGANLGYNGFYGGWYRDPYYNDNWRNQSSIVTFSALAQYCFSTDKLKPYAGADLGFYFWSWRWYYGYGYWGPGHPGQYDYSRGTALGLAPTGGIMYDVTDKLILDANLKFNLVLTESSLSFMGVNFGLFYKLDK